MSERPASRSASFRPEADDPAFADRLAAECLARWRALPKQGKPALRGKKKEWTVLAGIAVVRVTSEAKKEYTIRCVALGAGLKCLPESKLGFAGDVVNDSHAEVLARRALVRHLLHQLELTLEGRGTGELFDFDAPGVAGAELAAAGLRWTASPPATFHMYVSQAPCGDASMAPLAAAQTPESARAFHEGRQRMQRSELAHPTKKAKISGDVGYGFPGLAIGVADTAEQIRRGRFDFAARGVLRTKPGRVDSEATLCMSCSDKIALWNVLGLQGALLSRLLPSPVRLRSIVVGEMYDEESLKRAFCDRIAGVTAPPPYGAHAPVILHTGLRFEHSRTETPLGDCQVHVPASTALLWYLGCPRPSEALVDGRKQGSSPDKAGVFPSRARSSVCKASILEAFDHVRRLLGRSSNNGVGGAEVTTIRATYAEHKAMAVEYGLARAALLSIPAFSAWVFSGKEREAFSLGTDGSPPMVLST